SHCGSLAEGGGKESDAIEGMEIATRSKGSAERTIPKRKVSSPPHSSNGHSPSETSSSPVKKKKKPGAVNNSKDQDGRNDFYCWVCHREGQVLCCELCPRVYHAKCLKLAAEPEGDWFCPECEKITVAECIETQSKAMTMLTLDQLSFLLKFALQKMKQPGTEPFQKPVSLEQHPDYAEYIFHPMDLCTLEKNIKKKMYGSTEAFLADVKWILHNCIIYNGGNHKLTATAKVIVKICEHEMNEIEVCPECYLSACQKRDNWFCEPCSNPHPLVWAKLKGFPFWPAKALRDKDGQVDARFFGQHDRAWVPINNCYLMSKEIPFSVKKTKSIFNSAMQEMEVYVENIRKKFGVFNYAPFRTPYTPDNQFQMLLDPANPSAGSVKPEKQEKIKFSFDVTASPKLLVGKSMVSSGNVGGGTGRRISMSDMPRSPMSTNSSAHTGSDGEQETAEKGHARAALPHYNTGEESVDCTASPAPPRAGLTGNTLESPKPFHSSAPSTPVKQEKTPTTGSILNLNLDRSKAEMDLKELSESVQQQQQQGAQPSLTSPKRQIRSRFQLNLDKTIESCKAQLGIDEISEDVYKGVEHSDSEESDKSDSSDSEYGSDDEQKSKSGQDDKNTVDDKTEKEPPKKKAKPSVAAGEDKDSSTESAATATTATKGEPSQKTSTSEPIAKDKPGIDSEKESPASPDSREKPKSSEEAMPPASVDVDSDSERELVIDLGEEQAGKERKRNRKDSAAVTALKEPTASKPEGKATPISSSLTQPQNSTVLSSSPTVKDPSQSPLAVPLNIIPLTAAPTSTTLTSSTLPITTPSTANSSSPISTNTVKKQRPLLPRETVPVVQQAVVWNPTTKFQTSSQKWHMQKTTSTSAVTLVTSTPVSVSMSSSSSSSTSTTGDFQIPTTSADVAADIAKYTNKIRRLRIEIEKLQWLHQQELSEMKHNLELTMAEMRQSLEQERERIVTEVKKQMEVEKQQAVDETKKKQWCANCRKEAIFYCCWNTSYCDYPCQQAHWPEHMKSCTQSATSSQQEQESESSIDVTPKAPGQPNNSPRETVSATPADKDSEVDKAKDSVAVTMS
uniref:Zinc finger, MYND-type containing 8 n=1 Tax=Cyprinus carpio carpio TaxID=630221 RepID=A0A8C1HWV7_CYPCA